MPLISSAADSLTVKEVREAEGRDADQSAVAWEMYSMLPATLAGASIVCVRHPLSIAGLKSAIESLWNGQKSEGV
jgi:acetyl-CoA decarbonylase/synthase complex subunit delta